MIEQPALKLKVDAVRTITPRVKEFTLTRCDRGRLPAWSPGSHIVLHFGDGRKAWRNSYSLAGSPDELSSYRIAVRREDPDRSNGGSLYLHESVAAGAVIPCQAPSNGFPLARKARKHILIAGGIGITPFLSQMEAIRAAGVDYELHYAYRSREESAYRHDIEATHSGNAHYYVSEDGVRLSAAAALARQPAGAHAYVCGPSSLISSVAGAAAQLGWPASSVHIERFAPPPAGEAAPFVVELPELGIEVPVGSRETVLEALSSAGAQVDYSCRAGQCGTCVMYVAAGEPDHRDLCLDEEEARGGSFIPCVSRCLKERLVLRKTPLATAG